MRELTATQIGVLERMMAHGFAPMIIPLYANSIGIRRNGFAILLEPIQDSGWRILGEPCYVIDGNLSVLVRRQGREWFVCKRKEVEATSEMLAERARFSEDLSRLLAIPAPEV
jgi:hypothetical protein